MASSIGKKWWYVSFAFTDGFIGACLVEAEDMNGAIRESHRLKINPGNCSVLVLEVPDIPETWGQFPMDKRNRLLSRDEIGPGKRLSELDSEEEVALNQSMEGGGWVDRE